MKVFDVCGLGNALVDVLVDVSAPTFEALGLEKATMRLVSQEEQEDLLSKLGPISPKLVSGGSVSNSIIAIAQLGGRPALLCSVGDDRYGLFFKSECDALGVEVGNPIRVGKMTGTCVSLITPDAERTMRTCLGAAASLTATELDEDLIKKSKWLFIEGYVLTNPEVGAQTALRAAELAEKFGTKIAVTISEDFVVATQNEALRRILAKASLVFANEREACALTGAAEYRQAFDRMNEIAPSFAVTGRPKGALVRYDGVVAEIPAFPCTPVDLTGAGDMFAGAFLYGITSGHSVEDAGRGACFLAGQIIQRHGARLPMGVKEHWDQAVGSVASAAL